MTTALCPSCGRPLDDHNRHIRFGVPESVLDVPQEERAARTWGNDVLMQVRDVGAFVRILVPVKLTGGYTLTYGAWLSVRAEDFHHACEQWWAPTYGSFRVGGLLANMLPGWESESYLKPVEAVVLDVEHVPYAIESTDEFMRHVLHDEWPHEAVLAAVAPYV